MRSIAIVGCGPMALYLLNELTRSSSPSIITVFERSGSLGTGTPYRHETNHPDLLANIASIEIPQLYESLESWLQSRTSEGLSVLGIERGDINGRAFFPRVVLGSYFRDQFVRLCEQAPARGHKVATFLHHEVCDVSIDAGSLRVMSKETTTGEVGSRNFDHVILATGHGSDIAIDADPHQMFHTSPYPTSRLSNAPEGRVGILGTSLSAIDAVVSIANLHGTFAGDDVSNSFVPNSQSSKLQLTMMSRSGFLPGTDFLVPVPYEPLSVFTINAVQDEVGRGSAGLLQRLVELFKAEIKECDPDYYASNDLAGSDAFGIADVYFGPRRRSDAVEWARHDLETTLQLNRAGVVVGWKYAILRMHEVFETAVAHLSSSDRATFDKTLKKVFVDNYAAVPAASIGKLIALIDQGVLSVRALGDDYQMDMTQRTAPYRVSVSGSELLFDYFVDATGQSSHQLSELPFPSLASVAETHREQTHSNAAGVPVIAYGSRSIFVAALPFLLTDRPFAQGIVTCHEIAQRIAQAVALQERPSDSLKEIMTKPLADDGATIRFQPSGVSTAVDNAMAKLASVQEVLQTAQAGPSPH